MTKIAFLLTLIVTALTNMRRASLLGIIALGLAWTTGAQAQLLPASADIFLQWTGIVGNSKQFRGQIDLFSYSQTASNNNGLNTVCGAVTITKPVDNTTPTFLRLLFSGAVTSEATVTFVQPAAGGAPATFYTVRLDNVRVISVTQSDSHFTNAPALVIETIALSATQFRFTSGSTFGWDCAANKPL
jgi:type VI protein secretion system component Hcp